MLKIAADNMWLLFRVIVLFVSVASVLCHGCDDDPCGDKGECENIEDTHYCCHCVPGYGGEDCSERQQSAKKCVYCSANQIPAPDGTRSHTVCECTDGNMLPTCADDEECFHEAGMIELESGLRKPVGDVSVGDRVLSVDNARHSAVYSRVVAILHRTRDNRKGTRFVRISTESGQTISLTPAHLLHTCRHPSRTQPVFASDMQVGDYLCVSDGNYSEGITPSRVVGAEQIVEWDSGALSPLTEHGNIIVNGVLASCYGHVKDDATAHLAFTPLRLMLRLYGPQWGDSGPHRAHRAVHWYPTLLTTAARLIMPKSAFYNGVIPEF